MEQLTQTCGFSPFCSASFYRTFGLVSHFNEACQHLMCGDGEVALKLQTFCCFYLDKSLLQPQEAELL